MTPNEIREISVTLSNEIKGKPLKYARNFVHSKGHIFRIVSQDGLTYDGDTYYKPERINASIIDGFVVEVSVG